MHILISLLFVLLAFAFTAACAVTFDTLRAKTEDLGNALYLRASWKDPWLSLIPKEEYPEGAGFVRSSFSISRSEPTSEEETWNAIAPIDTGDHTTGACAVTYNEASVGMHEDTYKPENFGLVGPLICQDDLPMYYRSKDFWQKYFMQLEIRNKKSVINRLGNVYRQYVPKASANSSFAFVDGNIVTQPAPAIVDMTGLDGANIPTSEVTQEMLDETAQLLMQAGASDPNSNGWITLGPDGPIFTLYLGMWASKRLLQNNSELRSDYNNSYQGLKDANPVIQRMGASRVIGNFRHLINLFPARWTTGTMTDGRVNAGTTDPNNPLLRVPIWLTSALGAGTGNKGKNVTLNPDWVNPALANYESMEVLSPWVFTEEPIKPVNSVPGMKWQPQNYFGEWQFVTGNDALVGFDDCTGIQDPMHKRGRHFAEYRHANHPIFPEYGRMILFRRCASAYDTISCS